VRYAGFLSRVVAFLIDGAILGVLGAIYALGYPVFPGRALLMVALASAFTSPSRCASKVAPARLLKTAPVFMLKSLVDSRKSLVLSDD